MAPGYDRPTRSSRIDRDPPSSRPIGTDYRYIPLSRLMAFQTADGNFSIQDSDVDVYWPLLLNFASGVQNDVMHVFIFGHESTGLDITRIVRKAIASPSFRAFQELSKKEPFSLLLERTPVRFKASLDDFQTFRKLLTDVTLTVLAIVYIQRRHAESKGLWEFFVQKARVWVGKEVQSIRMDNSIDNPKLDFSRGKQSPKKLLEKMEQVADAEFLEHEKESFAAYRRLKATLSKHLCAWTRKVLFRLDLFQRSAK